MHGLWQDLRHSARLFARTPGFTLTAVVVLALGIGVNTAVFTAMNTLLFEPIGGPAPGELVGVFARDAGPKGGYRPFSYPDYRDLSAAARSSPVFASLMAQGMVTVGVTEGSVTRKTYACLASSSYFETLGVRLPAGRGFHQAEETSSAQPVVVVSRAYWERHGGETSLGRQIIVNNRALTIVGAVPKGFSGTTALISPELWIPLGAAPLLGPDVAAAEGPGTDRLRRSLMVVGRLRPGLSLDAAGPLVAPLASRLREAAPLENKDLEVVAGPLSRFSLGAGPRDDTEVAGVFLFLAGMSAIVLLIACLNLANMMLARGSARGREVAIRLAVGGSRARVIRQLMTESMLLSSAGAALGLAVSIGGTALLFRNLSSVLPLPVVFEPAPDLRTLGAAAVISTLATIAFGLGPALAMAKGEILAPLKHRADRASVAWRGVPVRNLLAVGQLALCLALLTAAGLFVRGAFAAGTADPGFPLERGLVASTDASLAGYDEGRGREAYRLVMSRVRGMPGVESASIASAVPLGLEGSFNAVRRSGEGKPEDAVAAATVIVGCGYFRTVALPLLRGRDFTSAEEVSGSASRPAIVDLPMAQRLWPGEDPLGRRIQLDAGDSPDGEWSAPLEVVGVVAGVRDSLFDKTLSPHVYLPFGSEYRAAMHVHARLRSSDPAAASAAIAEVRREIRAADAGLPVLSLKTLVDHRDTSVFVWMARASAQVFLAFGLSALVLAVLGVYGVKAYLVSRRTHEIGIRTALGATRLDVLALVLRDGMWLTVGGLLAGGVLALALSKVLAAWVYGVTGIEPAVLLAAALILGGAALLACYLPARRAMAVAPSVALRAE